VVSKDDLIAAVWDGRIVSDAALTTRLNVARGAIGDNGEQQRLIKTLPRKGFRFVGPVREEEGAGPQEAAHGGRQDPERQHAGPAPRQRIQFARAADGVRIAWASVGSGLAVVRACNFLNHLERDWESPVWAPFLHAIAKDYRLVRHDSRGNGLSDREPGN